jgi:hypothetical protein
MGWPIRVVGASIAVWAVVGLAKMMTDNNPMRIVVVFDMKNLRILNRNQIGNIPPWPEGMALSKIRPCKTIVVSWAASLPHNYQEHRMRRQPWHEGKPPHLYSVYWTANCEGERQKNLAHGSTG